MTCKNNSKEVNHDKCEGNWVKEQDGMLFTEVYKPIVAGIKKKKLARSPQNLSKIDQIYISVRDKISDICNE